MTGLNLSASNHVNTANSSSQSSASTVAGININVLAAHPSGLPDGGVGSVADGTGGIAALQQVVGGGIENLLQVMSGGIADLLQLVGGGITDLLQVVGVALRTCCR